MQKYKGSEHKLYLEICKKYDISPLSEYLGDADEPIPLVDIESHVEEVTPAHLNVESAWSLAFLDKSTYPPEIRKTLLKLSEAKMMHKFPREKE